MLLPRLLLLAINYIDRLQYGQSVVREQRFCLLDDDSAIEKANSDHFVPFVVEVE